MELVLIRKEGIKKILCVVTQLDRIVIRMTTKIGTWYFCIYLIFLSIGCKQEEPKNILTSYETAFKERIKNTNISSLEITYYTLCDANDIDPVSKEIFKYDTLGNMIGYEYLKRGNIASPLKRYELTLYRYDQDEKKISEITYFQNDSSIEKRFIYAQNKQLIAEILQSQDRKVINLNIYEYDSLGRLYKDNEYIVRNSKILGSALYPVRPITITYDTIKKKKNRIYNDPIITTVDTELLFQPFGKGYIAGHLPRALIKYDSLGFVIEENDIYGFKYRYKNILDGKGNILERIGYQNGTECCLEKYHYKYFKQ